MRWEYREADSELEERIRVELRAILEHMGEEAPSEASEILPIVGVDDFLYFRTDAARYAVAGDGAIRYVVVDGTERADAFKDGELIRTLVFPAIPQNN